MDKNFTLNVGAGGVFSKIMFAIQNIQKINPDFESIYINNVDKRTLTDDKNIFNFIFEQNKIQNNIAYNAKNLGSYSKFNPIEISPNLNDYKKIVNKLKFTKEFNDKLNFYLNNLNIDDSFIGLHIRLCDMNILHKKEYGVLSFNDFLFELKKHINKNSKIFVASDNNESIKKLMDIYGDKIYYIGDFIRGNSEEEDTSVLQINNFKNIDLWVQAFIEMLLLAKCGTLICRTSNLNNTSVIYSNSLKKIIRL